MKDSNNDLNLLKKTKAWLQKEGYPLELKTAKIFENAGYSIAQGEYYNDAETNKLLCSDCSIILRSGWRTRSWELCPRKSVYPSSHEVR